MGQQHDQAVQTEGDAAVRRRAEAEGLEQMAEHEGLLVRVDAEDAEHFRLQVGLVDTDAAAADFHAGAGGGLDPRAGELGRRGLVDQLQPTPDRSVVLAADQVIAVRDPWGFRPLSVGRLPNGGYAVASETCALSTLGCVDVDEVAAGEMVTLQGAEIERQQVLAPKPRQARCTFEFVYFSRPDSVWDGRSVHHVRQRLGAELAKESMADPAFEADVIIPVPDSSIPAAIGFSGESGLPFNDGLIKNRYIGRTFIAPTQALRSAAVRYRFSLLPAIFGSATQ